MRKFLCIILICLICSITTIAFAANTSELQNKQQQVQDQINQANNELSDLKMDITENLEQVQKLDEKIANAEKELSETTEKVQILQTTIQQLEEQQKEEQEKYDSQKEIFEQRVVALYEAGDTQYLDVILSSASLDDFLSNYFLVTELATYDEQLLEEVETKKNIIELANKRLNENLEQLKTIKQTQLTTSKVLQNTKALRENYITKLSDKEKAIQTQIDEYNNQFAEVNKEILALSNVDVLSDKYIGGVMAWPIPGYTKITSNYGMRTHPITGVYKLHTGVDVSAPIGANFVAANDGIVTKACYNAAYGNMVIIDHGGGISTLYAHGSEILVQVGQAVTRGEAVLKVGSTGYSTGAHAHFEVRINGEVTNPIEYITTNKIPESTKQNKNENTTDTENENTLNTTNTTN